MADWTGPDAGRNDGADPEPRCTLVVDPLGTVRLAGGDTDAVLGLPPRQITNRHLADLLSRPDRERLFAEMRRHLLGTTPGATASGSRAVTCEPMRASDAANIEGWIVRLHAPDRRPRSDADDRPASSPAARTVPDVAEVSIDLRPTLELAANRWRTDAESTQP